MSYWRLGMGGWVSLLSIYLPTSHAVPSLANLINALNHLLGGGRIRAAGDVAFHLV